MEKNQQIAQGVESAWAEQGLPTFKSWLRDDLAGGARRNAARRSFPLRPEVDHQHVRHDRAEHLTECLVFRVRQVGVAILLGGEGHDEAVREPLVLLLGADVGAPVQARDAGDLVFRASNAFSTALTCSGSASCLNFSGDDVIEHFSLPSAYARASGAAADIETSERTRRPRAGLGSSSRARIRTPAAARVQASAATRSPPRRPANSAHPPVGKS